MKNIIPAIVLCLCFAFGLGLGLYAVSDSVVPGVVFCFLGPAILFLPKLTTPAAAAPAPEFAAMPASREDRMAARVNAAFARSNSAQGDAPEFSAVEHRGQRR